MNLKEADGEAKKRKISLAYKKEERERERRKHKLKEEMQKMKHLEAWKLAEEEAQKKILNSNCYRI